jgi:hypothetical protein
MTRLEEIKEILVKHKADISARYKVKEIGIFGSLVRGELKRGSDVDILVDFDEAPDLLTFIELERYLERQLRKKVDLVDRGGLRPQLRERILNEVLYV